VAPPLIATAKGCHVRSRQSPDAREGGDEEAVIVAPDLAASGDLKPVVDRIGRVLGHTVARRVEPVIANVVHVGRQGQLVGCLPDDVTSLR